MSEAANLARFVRLRSRFVRSIHLVRDFHSPSPSGYLLTECGLSALQAVETALATPSQRALSIIGPYGAGKSAFCVHLASLALNAGVTRTRLLPVLVVGSRRPLASSLVDGLQATLNTLGDQAADLRREAARLQENPAAQAIANLFLKASAIVQASGIADGLLLVVDELGKFLEHAALHPDQGDVFALQELAEAAARSSQDNPLIVLTVLHQSADTYARSLGPTQQAEWAKIAERFRSLPFFPSDRERIDVIGQALEQDPTVGELTGLSGLARLCAGRGMAPTGIGEAFPALVHASYPLHPIVLLALPALFRRAGQSHRSVFNFLAGEEANSLGRFLEETSFDPLLPPLYGLERLYDYATEALPGVWSGPSSSLWAEVNDAVERADDLSPLSLQLLKCVGLLGLLKSPRLPASQPALELVLTNSRGERPDVETALDELVQRRYLVYSRMRQSYRFWQGGDVDVESEIERAALGLSRESWLQTARDLCPPPTLIARRHSFEVGTLRTITSEPCAASGLREHLERKDGHLRWTLCLAQTAEEAAAARLIANQYSDPDTLISIAFETETLLQAGSDVAAAEYVQRNVSELAHDRAARRELAGRRQDAETAFRGEWNRLFGADPEGTRWYWRGSECKIKDRRALSEQLSVMADETFSASPRLRNELINRPNLSSSAAAGRRNLIEAMLTHRQEKRLGIVGFPPESSMYECLLGSTGLHHLAANDLWEFGLTAEDPAGLRDVWEAFSEIIFTEPPEQCSVRKLWERFKAPPYGLTEGALPVLLCAFLLAHDSETTLYREGTFLAEPGVADWELLLRRPEMFSVAGCRVTGSRHRVVERLSRGFKVSAAVVPVVRALVRTVRSLPDHAWKTRRLMASTLSVREAFEKARSPERLLFVDLPSALGINLNNEASDEADEANTERFFIELNKSLKDWDEALPRLLSQARADLLASCSLPSTDAGWASLRERCLLLEGRVAHPLLIPFVRHILSGDGAIAIERALAFLGDRPPRNWSDLDYERFLAQSRAVGELMRQADTEDVLLPEANLSPQELSQSQRLADKILMQSGASPRVLRAALLILIKKLTIAEKESLDDEKS